MRTPNPREEYSVQLRELLLVALELLLVARLLLLGACILT